MSDIYEHKSTQYKHCTAIPPKDRIGRQYKPSYQTLAQFTCPPGHVTPQDHMTSLHIFYVKLRSTLAKLSATWR
jgi:hypothetical protein